MLRDAIERISVHSIFVAEIQFHDAAPAAQPHARLDSRAGLRPTDAHRIVNREQLAARAAEDADARRELAADEDIGLAQPRVVDEGMLNGAPALEIDVHGR